MVAHAMAAYMFVNGGTLGEIEMASAKRIVHESFTRSITTMVNAVTEDHVRTKMTQLIEHGVFPKVGGDLSATTAAGVRVKVTLPAAVRAVPQRVTVGRAGAGAEPTPANGDVIPPKVLFKRRAAGLDMLLAAAEAADAAPTVMTTRSKRRRVASADEA